ncbi:hypothetical protein ANO11243_051280 [Dothideomycetidae sp. 11243]|nr:hypothetical protein ANO11243_051280 [fungal sp. No.11243]
MPSRKSKRARLSAPAHSPPLTNGNNALHASFTSWSQARGITINGVAPARLPGRGMGLITTRRIRKSEKLVIVPEKAMLCPRPSEQKGLSPQARLASTLLALSRSDDADYAQCRSVWPSSHDFRTGLAWFASEDRNWDLKDLFPPSLVRMLERLRRDMQTDREALDEDEGEDFAYHWAIANTRSFSWKPPGKREGVMVLYGFTLPDSADDSISLDDTMLPHFTPDQRQTLEAVGYLGNYSLTPTTGEVCFRTQVALRTTLLTANEWEYFMASGEDIADDKTDEVRVLLCGMIRARMTGMAGTKQKLDDARQSGMGNEMVLSSILERWRQIIDALQKYIDPI